MEKIADKLINTVHEMVSKPMPAIGDLKGAETVIFKKDHKECAGMMGAVINIRKESGTVDVKVGNANRLEVPLTDLELVDAKYAFAPGASEALEPTEGDDEPVTLGEEIDTFLKEFDEKAAGGDKLKPHHDKIKALQMAMSAAHRQKKGTGDASRKASTDSKLDSLRKEIDQEYAAIRKLKGK